MVDEVGVAVNVVVEVGVAVKVVEPVGVPVAVDVVVAERLTVVVPEAVIDAVAVVVKVGVDDPVGGSAVGLTDTASCPTTILTPQASGRVRVAE